MLYCGGVFLYVNHKLCNLVQHYVKVSCKSKIKTKFGYILNVYINTNSVKMLKVVQSKNLRKNKTFKKHNFNTIL